MKKYFLYTIGMILVINVIGVIAVLAVFTFNRFEQISYDFERVDLQVITTGNLIIEDAPAGVANNINVSVRNLSSTPVLIRVIPVEEWTNEQGEPIPGSNITIAYHSLVEVNQVAPTASSNVGKKWFRGTDGYLYFYELVCPMETTTQLATSFTITSDQGDFAGATLNLRFLAESVQAEGNVWSNLMNASGIPVVVVNNWTAGGRHTTTDLLTLPRVVKNCT